MRRLLAAALLQVPVVPALAQLPDGYRLQAQMRDTAYVLGDLLDQRIDIAAPAGATLDSASLPALGAVNNWMELRERRVEHRRGAYTLLLRYQVFAAVETPLQLAVPGFRLRFTQAQDSAVLPVAPQPFYLSPVLPATLGERERKPRDSLAPQPLPERGPLAGLALSLLAAAILGLYLAWAYDRLPFLPRAPGPLALLLRRLRRRAEAQDADAYAGLLREVQMAFNCCARETLYADNLALLFARAPWLQPLRAEIEALFRHTRGVFYEAAPAPGAWPPARVIALCRQARDCERGLR